MKTKTKGVDLDIDIESLANGFSKAAKIIQMEKPDFILAPVAGSVPFIDLLSIVDRKFDINSVIYMPNSSRFYDREGLMAQWYSKFYEQNEVGEPIKLMCVDEVLSGSSAIVGFRQYQASIEERAKAKARDLDGTPESFEYFKKKLGKKVQYKILGMGERGHKRNPEFTRLINKKYVHIIEFDNIPTIDDVKYNPIRFKIDRMQSNGRAVYLPEIENFVVTPEYMALLQNIASYVGADHSKISPVNFSKIEEGLSMAKITN